MPKIDGKSLLSALLALSALAACSSEDQAARPAPEDPARVFSEEDKGIARALSISGNQALADADNPYAQALLCRNGMDVLAERFREAEGLSQEQRQGMEQARAYFDGELRVLGETEGKAAAEIDSDLEQTAQDNLDIAENVRTAIACLQGLRNAG